MPQYTANIDLLNLDGSNGFKLIGASANDRSGISVGSAGDVNGDGFADMIIGAPGVDRDVVHGGAYYGQGASYVVFGSASGFAANVDLLSLDGSNGFTFLGWPLDYAGHSVASADDVNGDGFDDITVGAPFEDYDVGQAYVVFGKASGFAATVPAETLNGSNGFRMFAGYDAFFGISVASAGDVNGDGFADVIVGEPKAANGYDYYAGATYVVFGKASGFAGAFSARSLDGSDGFRLRGAAYEYSGSSVASAGDVNGDGFADVIVGTRGANTSYVVFGKASGFDASIDLSSLDGSNGFKLSGGAGAHAGSSVASAGDVNGDGFADLIVAAPGIGQSYVVFGKASGFAANLNLPSLNGSNGFKVIGAGALVAAAGDVNGDGLADLIVSDGSTSYVVLGKASGFANISVSNLNGSNGFKLSGAGYSVASAGDINGDGFADMIVGDPNAAPNGVRSGASYVVYGRAPDTAVNRVGTSASQTLAGGTYDDMLSGLAGDDKLFGNGGSDTLAGGLGADLLNGGAGIDYASYADAAAAIAVSLGKPENNTGEAAGDTYLSIEGLIGSAFDDALIGDGGDNWLVGGAGADLLNGKAGKDTAAYDQAASRVIVSLLAPAGNTGEAAGDIYIGIENLSGSRFSDTLTGDSGINRLDGNAGGDRLYGGGADDILAGGLGGDHLDGGDGFDYASYEGAAAAVVASLGKAFNNTGEATGDSYVSIEGLIGSAFDDALIGDGGSNWLIGGLGADRLNGKAGIDTVGYDDAASDVTASLVAPAGNTGEAAGDTYVGIENLSGSRFADTLTGDNGANRLDGNGGDDVLDGGAARDVLVGGAGRDTIGFSTALGPNNIDMVVGFNVADDSIALSHAIFAQAGAIGALSADAFYIGPVAHDASDRIIYNQTSGALFYDPDGTGSQKGSQFATVRTGLALTASHFSIV